MAKAKADEGRGYRDYQLTDAQVANKQRLDLPVHYTSNDCSFDWNSGYCICGQLNPNWKPQPFRDPRPDTRGKVSLDTYEGDQNYK